MLREIEAENEVPDLRDTEGDALEMDRTKNQSKTEPIEEHAAHSKPLEHRTASFY